ncbi:helix-turn-helix domain-containing protein [Rhodomicrobium vannielii ATCC 17100]|uniref:MerR family transcriptional regulator n=1 Tax=Rhodomicrobium vannielii TaxID=1069 RepID=UPI00191A9242|nr:helix-turn-helix domain-containing protein [Rhodomicrobium vannielii]MBJ7532966.1 helix-turn-helix domain-containing protein [Rhodomicrobium vannielii ATCC 17100]
MKDGMPIGELSRATGVKVPTIRYYEQVGLLPEPPRTRSDRRIYDDSAIKRLRFIRHARELGFDVDAIRQLLDLSDQPQRSCAKVDAIARRHLEEISSRLARLAILKEELERMISQCSQEKIAQCRILDVLSHHEHCLHHDHSTATPQA